MHDAQTGYDVDKPVQALPVASQLLHHVLAGGGGERDEQHEGGKADRDEWPLDDVPGDAGRVKELIQPEISREVQAGVEKGEQA